jgi:hypothetical protein
MLAAPARKAVKNFESALGQRPPIGAIEVIFSDDVNNEELRLLLQQRFPWCCYVQRRLTA